MITVTPVANWPFSYIMGTVVLDQPIQMTGPVLIGGFIGVNASFILLWKSPSVATQNAMANGTVGTLTFAAHDGSEMAAQVQVSSVSTGGIFLATCRVLTAVSVYRYVIVTQCY